MTLIFEFEAVPIGAAVGVAVGEDSTLERDIQPLAETRTIAAINSKGNAYLSGVLTCCLIILATGFMPFSLLPLSREFKRPAQH